MLTSNLSFMLTIHTASMAQSVVFNQPLLCNERKVGKNNFAPSRVAVEFNNQMLKTGACVACHCDEPLPASDLEPKHI